MYPRYRSVLHKQIYGTICDEPPVLTVEVPLSLQRSKLRKQAWLLI
jgi:hypothetical protein